MLTSQWHLHQPLPRTLHSTNWGAALGNVENVKLAVATLRDMLSDAVFLDEEAFASATTLQLYQQRLQVKMYRRWPWSRKQQHACMHGSCIRFWSFNTDCFAGPQFMLTNPVHSKLLGTLAYLSPAAIAPPTVHQLNSTQSTRLSRHNARPRCGACVSLRR